MLEELGDRVEGRAMDYAASLLGLFLPHLALVGLLLAQAALLVVNGRQRSMEPHDLGMVLLLGWWISC